MSIDFPLGLEPHFLTVDQTAQYLDITVDLAVCLIEQGSLFAYAAIPAAPMLLVPEGFEDVVRKVISSPESFPDFDLRKKLTIRAGIFSISKETVKSVAIKGSALVDTVWTLTPFDKGYLDIDKNSPEWFGGDRFWLENPIEITLSNIRVPFFLAKKHRELIDLDLQAKAIISNQRTENPLGESEQLTLEGKAYLSEIGRQNANIGHADRNQLYRDVVDQVRQLWKSGDPRMHSDMAKHFYKQHPSLSPNELRRRLVALANEINRQDLIRGTKKKAD